MTVNYPTGDRFIEGNDDYGQQVGLVATVYTVGGREMLS